MGHLAIVPVAAVTDPRVSPAMLRVLALLGSYANKDGWCYPAMETLGDRLGVSRAAIHKQIGALVVAGYVEKTTRPGWSGRPGRPSCLYRVLYDRPAGTAMEAAEAAGLLTPGKQMASGLFTSEQGLSTSGGLQKVPLEGPKEKKALPPLPDGPTPAFFEAWSHYPPREGNSRAAAWHQWRARLREARKQGRSMADEEAVMLAGTMGYAAHCARRAAADPTWKPDYVKLGATFYGRGRHYEADYGPVEAALPPMYLSDDDEREGIFNPAWVRATQ